MEIKTKQKLEAGILSNAKEYVNIHLTDNDKARAQKILSGELKMLREETSSIQNDELRKQKQTFDIERGKEQSELEKSKFSLEKGKHEHQIKLECSKLTIERSKTKLEKEKFEHSKKIEDRKLDIEEKRIELEYAKLENERLVKLEEQKKDKKSFLIGILMKSLELAVPLAINAALVMMNFRLIYADDGRVPSEMKDLMKNVYRK